MLIGAFIAIGLQSQGGFKSFTWVSTLPPILMILAFKLYCNRRFDQAFRYYIPSEEELRQAKIHSERADHKGHRLEKRFGHPALQADLFTPLLHARMMPLLAEVYKGRIDRDQAMVGEYGGQKMDAQVVEGGVKFAAVDQRDLEYDPVLYQRDRGELDWDQRSIGTTHILGGEGPGLHPQKSTFYANPSAAPSRYNAYLNQGPGMHSDIELSRLDTNADNLPLLNGQQGYFDGAQPGRHYQSPSSASPRNQSPHGSPYGGPPPGISPHTQYPPTPAMYNDGYREAPIHRPNPPPHQRQSSNFSQQGRGAPAYGNHNRPPSNYSMHSAEQPNMAGRGTFRPQ